METISADTTLDHLGFDELAALLHSEGVSRAHAVVAAVDFMAHSE